MCSTRLVALLLLLTCYGVKSQDEDQVIDLQNLLVNVSSTLEMFKQHLSTLTHTLTEAMADVKGTVEKSVAEMGKSCNSEPQRVFRDCSDVLKAGHNKTSVFRIKPIGMLDDFEVYCDMDTDGGGWTLFQKRGDYSFPEDYFYKTWREYQAGFGDLNSEFWLGNDRISAISNQRKYELRIDLWDLERTRVYAQYEHFSMSPESEDYRLSVAGYSGNAGDSLLQSHNGMKFTTKDRDNDIWAGGNCAVVHNKGGWWYSSCHDSNLNGLNLKGPNDKRYQGIEWGGWKGVRYSISYTEMKIRPVVNNFD